MALRVEHLPLQLPVSVRMVAKLVEEIGHKAQKAGRWEKHITVVLQDVWYGVEEEY